MLPPTERFSDRVADYVRARPSYPPEVLELLISEYKINSESAIADVGCGTGIFAKQLLSIGCSVIGVEPNESMRNAAISLLGHERNFEVVTGTGEDTGLPSRCVDLVTAAQAFHWFDQEKAYQEFSRILHPGGLVCLLWNERKSSGSDFLDGYEAVLKEFAPEYAHVKHRNNADQGILDWYRNDDAKIYSFTNDQVIDLDGLLGRAFSSSYLPAAGTPERDEIEGELRDLFQRTNKDGSVLFEYETKVFIGPLGHAVPSL